MPEGHIYYCPAHIVLDRSGIVAHEQKQDARSFGIEFFISLCLSMQAVISKVIVKDLSRLERDYVTVGQYTDIYFPDHNVRLIAINDLVDSDEGENEIAPFKNVMNDNLA